MSSGTARLKRRLDEQGINYVSKKAAENYCLIGTPLPPLEKKDANEFVPLWKQDVRDEKGRRRLHGAFTGGFSAGYFNSVGSKEGWAPSTFVSSRVDRAKQKVARPEDYMDEEDLAELRENQIMAGVKQQQQQQGVFGAPQPDSAHGDPEQDSIAASIQRALMPPLEDSPGVRLLKKMGWRPGQGVGPRVTWRTRKIQDLLAAGKSINGVDIDAFDEDDEEAKRHMYPPRDTVVPRFSMKSDSHGVGYTAGPGLAESLGQKHPEIKGPRLASGFGLGALNEAEDDDIDVYESASHANRTYMPYDSTRDADESASFNRSKSDHKAAITTQQRFPNGIIVLSGFALSPDPEQKDQWFPIPEVPSGWKPDPRRVWQKDPSVEKPGASTSTREPSSRRQKLTADERGAILGEEPLPSTRSVFDYLSKEDRERIEHAAAGLHPSAPDSTPPSVEAPSAPSSLPYTAPHIAAAALDGFKPFANDPAKQARYVAYLRSQSTPDHPEFLPPSKLPGQTSEAYHKELLDYSKSAGIFRPVSGAMANRFTTAAVVESGPTAVEGLHQPIHAPETALVPEREKEAPRQEEEEVQSSKAHAARTGMYGTLTREVTPWQPSRLLCKRFGVKDPNPDITTDTPMPGASRNQPQPQQGTTTAGGDTWKAEEALAEADLQTATGSAETGPSSAGRATRRDLENIGLGEDETQGRDTLTYVRPSMDIFKAIFASDDEDEDGGEEPEDGGGDDKGVQPVGQPEDVSRQMAMSDATAHSRTHDTTTYEPKTVNRPPAGSETVNVATFKPVFVPRAERGTQKSKDKDKKDGRGKDKKRVKSIVSFDDEGAALVIAPHAEKDKARKKKKRRKEEKGDADIVAAAGIDDDAEMWVEKAPPQVVASFVGAPTAAAEGEDQLEGAPAPPPTSSSTLVQRTEGPPRGRKRAIDFL